MMDMKLFEMAVQEMSTDQMIDFAVELYGTRLQPIDLSVEIKPRNPRCIVFGEVNCSL